MVRQRAPLSESFWVSLTSKRRAGGTLGVTESHSPAERRGFCSGNLFRGSRITELAIVLAGGDPAPPPLATRKWVTGLLGPPAVTCPPGGPLMCMEKHLCKPSLTRCPLRGRNCCRPRSAGHKFSSDTHHDEEPVVRSSAYFTLKLPLLGAKFLPPF